MEDNQIINLYFDRSEQAIKETDTKYGGYCYSIAYNITSWNHLYWQRQKPVYRTSRYAG